MRKKKRKKADKKDFVDFSPPEDLSGREEFGLKEAEQKTKVKRSFSIPIVFLVFFVVFLIAILFLLQIFEGLTRTKKSTGQDSEEACSLKEKMVVANWPSYTLPDEHVGFNYPQGSEITSQKKETGILIDFKIKKGESIKVTTSLLPENNEVFFSQELTQLKNLSGDKSLVFSNTTIAGSSAKMIKNFQGKNGDHVSIAFFQNESTLFEITATDPEKTNSSIFLTRTFQNFLQSFKKI